MSVIPLPRAGQTVALTVAVDRFLDRFRDDAATRHTYTETLTRLRAMAGDRLLTAELIPEIYEQVMERWTERAANTWNKHLSALNSFTAYARRQEWLATDPARRLDRRKVTRARDKAIPRSRDMEFRRALVIEKVGGRRATAPADVDPTTRRGRLSYPRAEYLFKQASIAYDPHGVGYTLHQLRHSGLTHLAAKGRSAPELRANPAIGT